MKLSKKADYGLLFLTYLAEHRYHFIPLSKIARHQEIPYKFLSQIALDLKNAQLVKSREGIGGGYKLSKPPQKISVAQIIIAVDGPFSPIGCMRGKSCPSHHHCLHRPVMQNLAEQITQTLSAYSLASLIHQSPQS